MFEASTIFAISSGPVPSGVAVVRISGQNSADAVRLLCGIKDPNPRQLVLRKIYSVDGELIDRGLIGFFAAPNSFTGEDCAEFHVHGSRAVIAALLEALASLPGLRQAEPGEFTRRAFINGKLDLTGAEALSDLISAETAQQRRLALANAGGRQSTLYGMWRQRLLHNRAMIEAELDFSDEGDVPGSVADVVWADMSALRREMIGHIHGFRAAEIVRDGFRTVILGPPNAGKSSLLNVLAGRDVAIVTDEPGTTRDVLEVALDLGGHKIIVSDTAGIREQPGAIEAIGIERANRAAETADLVLILEDGTLPPSGIRGPAGVEALYVNSKADLPGIHSPTGALAISSRTGAGIEQLLGAIRERASAHSASVAETAVPTRQRHVDLISGAAAGIDEALDASAPLELRVEGLRIAGDQIGRISGVIGPEDVLGEIFSSFCIGK